MGHDAVHLLDEVLYRLPDAQVLAKAREEARIVLTMDLDFARLLAVSNCDLPAVIIFRLKDERSECVNTRLAEVLGNYTEAILSVAIVSVGEHSIRVRRLPIGRG